MTVAALSSVVIYVEDGITTSFPAPFRYKSPSNLDLTRIGADGSETALAYGIDFTATAAPTDAGGTVTVPVPSTGTKLQIKRATPRSQQAEYPTNNRFPAATTENAFDTAMLIDQEQDDKVSDLDARTPSVPIGETIGPMPPLAGRALRLPTWDAGGNFSALAPLAGEQAFVTVNPNGAPAAMSFSAITGHGSNDDFDGGFDGIAGSGQDFDGGLDG